MPEKLMKTVFDWEYFAVYLSGPIDFAPDGESSWRDEWTDKLVNIGIKPKQIYNPCRKPLNGAQFNLDNEGELSRQCRAEKNWDQLDQILGQIMHVDLRLCDKSDLILVNFPRIGNDAIVQEALAEFSSPCFDPEEYQNHIEAKGPVENLINAYSNMRVPTYGTIHEIVIASLQRKPIFVVWEETGKSDCSAWIMRLVGHKNVFSNVDDLISHLDDISHGKIAFNANEWLLLDPKQV